MAYSGEFKVDNFRDEHESNSEWRMRREFLLTNVHTVPLDRLICLSRCFISIEVYGCTYPSEVMAQVQELSENVNPKIMAKQRERMSQKVPAYTATMNFVKSTHQYQSTDVSHVQDQNKQGFGGGGQYNGPGYFPQNFRGSMMGPRGGFCRPQGRFGGPGNVSQMSSSQQFGGPRGGFQSQQGFSGPSGPRQRFSSETQQRASSAGQKTFPSSYSGFVKPQKQEDHFEGGDGSSVPQSTPTQPIMNRPFSAPSMRHPYSGPRFPGNSAPRMTGKSAASGEGGGPIRAGIRGVGRGPRFGGAGRGSNTTSDNFSSVEAATAAAARATREATNPDIKCIVLASNNVYLGKFKRLTEEIKRLKSKRPNAIDTIHSAANIAHVSIQSEIESGPIVRGTGTFFCLVQFDGVNISVCTGLNKRAAKVEAFEIALKKLMKPFQRIVEIEGGAKEFQASDYDFPAEDPRQTVIKPTSTVVASISGGDGSSEGLNAFQKESNVEALVDIKKKNYMAKELKDFVLVEPQEHNSSVNGASILRRSADFSKMLLEYDFGAFGTGGNVRCVLKLEGNVLADIVAHSKMSSKIEASQKAVDILREKCWTILTKQVHDSNAPEITKEEMFDDLANCFSTSSASSMSVPIADGNKGKKLLEKMGWTGGGIGKDGGGIEEPVTMKQVINREGLGLDAKRGITGDFRSRITELLENYASSERQDDLVFSPHFRKDERVIIHTECRRLNLKSKSNGQGNARYLVIRRKRSAFQLLEHVMQCGGETARYKVVPPGERKYPWRPMASPAAPSNMGNAGKNQAASGKKAAPAGSMSTKPSLLSLPMQGMSAHNLINLAAEMLAQNHAGMTGKNGPAGMMGQNGPQMFGQNSPGMRPNGPHMFGQNSPGVMRPNGPAVMMGQSSPAGMMGQSSPAGMMEQNSGLLVQRGPNPAAVMGQVSQNRGLLGEKPVNFQGQNFPSTVMGQNFNSGMK